VPESDLTPPVEAALSGLAEQVDKLTQRLGQLSDHQAELERELLRDEWTGLPNRRAVVIAIHNAGIDSLATGDANCLIFMEVDELAAFNLAHGHQAGDEVLRSVAQQLAGTVASPDMVGYLGNNEFVILMHRIEEEWAVQRAEDICRRIAAQPVSIGPGQDCSIRLAYGVHQIAIGETPEQGMAEADRMLRLWKMNQISRLSASVPDL
jgi:diguanylate cyclase (GGDEF)-like protein